MSLSTSSSGTPPPAKRTVQPSHSKELRGDLAAEFFGLVVAAEDQDLLAVAGAADEAGTGLVGDRAVQARREVERRGGDAVVAVELLEEFHGRPDEAS
jgi:hypothetical protein